ncbi:MAG: DNA repair protein RadC [Deltaproteobacteria bacterium]|nr:DNA repair protein RadC [Deltaproteobacteria bacterium]
MSENITIRDWPESERPREMLLSRGPSALSDANLVAILLRTGNEGENAVSLARNLLATLGGLSGLVNASEKELGKFKGLGPAKISILLSLKEIIKRILNAKIIGKNAVNSPEEVVNYLTNTMKDLKKEVFKVIYLNNANCVLGVENVFEGTADQAMVYPREVVQRALEQSATGVIFAHNHPSGSLEPTQHDKEITIKLAKACRAVDIIPLDHIIIAGSQYRSLKEYLD